MEFTYQGYRSLLELLREQGYAFADYHDWTDTPRCVILRHDIDNDPAQAVRMAEVEAEAGGSSTWFVLLRTEFYNPASQETGARLRRILSLGHKIGLHFDEKAYPPLGREDVVQNIIKECGLLSALLETEVSSVSMHRPSPATLEADLQIPGVVNSYGRPFFHDFKYLSDSRRRWREPVEEIVCAGEYDRLHILTHAFWYHETEETLQQTVGAFIRGGNRARHEQMLENITDLPSILGEEAIL